MCLLINGNAATIPLADESVQVCVTSPPYHSLRKYSGDQGAIWGGSPDCDHLWGDERVVSSNMQIDFTNSGLKKDGRPEDRRLATNRVATDVRKGESEPSISQYCRLCGAWYGELGLEPNLDQYFKNIVEILREVKRVLRPDGLLFLNLGDRYASRAEAVTERSSTTQLKPKDLCGIPWRVALALQADGWYLRSDIIYQKLNPMPEPCTDRPTKSHEHLFMFSKSERYYYDHIAVKEPSKESWNPKEGFGRIRPKAEGMSEDQLSMHRTQFAHNSHHDDAEKTGRNRRDVWSIDEDEYLQFLAWKASRNGDKTDVWSMPTVALAERHFASYPPALVEPAIKAGTSAHGACTVCGAPFERLTSKTYGEDNTSMNHIAGGDRTIGQGWEGTHRRATVTTTTTGWRPTCDHYDDLYRRDYPQARSERKRRQRAMSGDWWSRVRKMPGKLDWPVKRCVVFDPFLGSGSSLIAARQVGVSGVGMDISIEYLGLARKRLELDKLDAWSEWTQSKTVYLDDREDQPALDDLPLFRNY